MEPLGHFPVEPDMEKKILQARLLEAQGSIAKGASTSGGAQKPSHSSSSFHTLSELTSATDMKQTLGSGASGVAVNKPMKWPGGGHMVGGRHVTGSGGHVTAFSGQGHSLRSGTSSHSATQSHTSVQEMETNQGEPQPGSSQIKEGSSVIAQATGTNPEGGSIIAQAMDTSSKPEGHTVQASHSVIAQATDSSHSETLVPSTKPHGAYITGPSQEQPMEITEGRSSSATAQGSFSTPLEGSSSTVERLSGASLPGPSSAKPEGIINFPPRDNNSMDISETVSRPDLDALPSNPAPSEPSLPDGAVGNDPRFFQRVGPGYTVVNQEAVNASNMQAELLRTIASNLQSALQEETQEKVQYSSSILRQHFLYLVNT